MQLYRSMISVFDPLYAKMCLGPKVTHIHKGTAMETKASCTPDMHSRTLNFCPVTLIDFYVQVIFVASTVSGAECLEQKGARTKPEGGMGY